MNEPVYQHYIPKSYLKYFAQAHKKVFLVDTIMREEQEIKVLPTKAICAEKNIYTFNQDQAGDPFALEKFYANEVDAIYPKVYERLVNSDVMHVTKETKREILNTVLSLKFRRPEPLQYKISKLERMFKRIIEHETNPEELITYQIDGSSYSFLMKNINEEIDVRQKNMKEQWLIDHFGQWQEFVDYKMVCGLDVIEVPEDIPIITSDNPVSLFDLNGKLDPPNPFDPNNMMEVPLDRRHYLVIHPNATSESAYQRIHRSKRDSYFAAGVNHKTQENADRRIIGYPGDLEIHFSSQNELNSDSPKAVNALINTMDKALQATALAEVINKNGGTILNQAVADKVKEMRKTKAMEGDALFESIVLELAKNGYFTV